MIKISRTLLVLNIAIVTSLSAQQQIRPDLVNIENEEQLIDAHLLMLQNKWSDAADLIERLKTDNPSNAVFHYELAKIYLELEQIEKATEHVEKAVTLDSDNAWYHEYAAFYFHALNETDKELKMLQKLMVLEPAKLKHYQKAAGCHVILGNAEKAIEVIKKYEKKNGASVSSIQERFFICEEAENWKKAETALKEWVDIAPSSISALESLAGLQRDRGKTEEASKTYQRILDIHPRHLEAQQFLLKTGQLNKEDKDLDWYADPSVSLDQKIGKILGMLQASEAPSIETLLPLAETTVKAHPKELKAKALQADLLFLNRKYAKALKLYYTVLEEDKNKKPIFVNSLECAYKTGHDQYLYEIGNEMMMYFPAMLEGYYYTAVAAWRKRAWSECKQLLSELVLMSRYDGEMQRKLAYLRAKMVLMTEESLSDALSVLEPLGDNPRNNAFANYLYAINGRSLEKPDKGTVSSWLPYDQMAALIHAAKKRDLKAVNVLEKSVQVPPELQSEKYYWLMSAYKLMSELDKATSYEDKLRKMKSFYIKE